MMKIVDLFFFFFLFHVDRTCLDGYQEGVSRCNCGETWKVYEGSAQIWNNILATQL